MAKKKEDDIVTSVPQPEVNIVTLVSKDDAFLAQVDSCRVSLRGIVEGTLQNCVEDA